MRVMTIKKTNPNLISRLTELNEKGLSKSEMARIAGVSKQAVTGWFRTGTMSKNSALAISDAMGVSIAWLLGEDVEENSGLTPNEAEMLQLYRQLPEADQENMIAAFGLRLKELDDFTEKYLQRRNKHSG